MSSTRVKCQFLGGLSLFNPHSSVEIRFQKVLETINHCFWLRFSSFLCVWSACFRWGFFLFCKEILSVRVILLDMWLQQTKKTSKDTEYLIMTHMTGQTDSHERKMHACVCVYVCVRVRVAFHYGLSVLQTLPGSHFHSFLESQTTVGRHVKQLQRR